MSYPSGRQIYTGFSLILSGVKCRSVQWKTHSTWVRKWTCSQSECKFTFSHSGWVSDYTQRSTAFEWNPCGYTRFECAVRYTWPLKSSAAVTLGCTRFECAVTLDHSSRVPLLHSIRVLLYTLDTQPFECRCYIYTFECRNNTLEHQPAMGDLVVVGACGRRLWQLGGLWICK